MTFKKPELNDIPIVFRVEKDVVRYIEDVMIERREFNKSVIHREIFMKGLKQFKKQQEKMRSIIAEVEEEDEDE